MSFIEEMKLDNYELVNAHFINNERTTIQVNFAQADNELQTTTYVLEAIGGDPNYEALLEHFDLDTIHEMTFKYIKQERADFENYVKYLAKAEGLYDDQVDATRAQILEDILEDNPEKEDSDELFKFKLSIFELDYIKSSTDRALKAELRKADTILKVIKCLIKFREASDEA